MSWEIREGDCLSVLSEMPDESVQCVVTSPPYWGLRDYGDEGQLGLESTPEQYVANLVAVFREVRRVLRSDGTVWLNLGDSYAANRSHQVSDSKHLAHDFAASNAGTVPPGLKPKDLVGIPWRTAFALQADGWWLRSDIIWAKPNPMPESVTDRPTRAHEYLFLLTKSARYFYDADAIREEPHQPSRGKVGQARYTKMGDHPKSRAEVCPYCAGSGEAYDPHTGEGPVCPNCGGNGKPPEQSNRPEYRPSLSNPTSRNRRSVWEITTQPYPEAHFATFPTKLVEPCILAGSRPSWAMVEPALVKSPLAERIGDDPSLVTGRAGYNRPRHPDEGTRPITQQEQAGYAKQLRVSPNRTAMEREAGEAFAHYIRTDSSGARPIPANLLERWIDRGWLWREIHPRLLPADPTTSVVLDPFCGSGTTGVVCLRHDRSFIGIELNPAYCELARNRIRDDAPLLNTQLEAVA